MSVLCNCVVLSLFAVLVCGEVAPSIPYARKITSQYSAAEKLLPYEGSAEGSAAGASPGSGSICSSSSIQYSIQQLKLRAFECVDKLQFENCCEPKFLRYDWLGSAIYPIRVSGRVKIAYCDMATDGGGWLVILRRGHGRKYYQDFFRSLRAFRFGFGKLDRDFWMGLENVHDFTHRDATELRVELVRDGEGAFYAHYDQFTVGDASTGYSMQVGGYRNSSSLPDSLSHSNGFPFTTSYEETRRPDVSAQYDRWSSFCTIVYDDSWWHGGRGNESCTRVSLLGYSQHSFVSTFPLIWEVNGEKKGFDHVEMKIRPKKWECGENQYSEQSVKQAILAQQDPKKIKNPFAEN